MSDQQTRSTARVFGSHAFAHVPYEDRAICVGTGLTVTTPNEVAIGNEINNLRIKEGKLYINDKLQEEVTDEAARELADAIKKMVTS